MRPVDFDTAPGRREGSILDRIGRELVQDHRDHLSGIRLEQHLRAANARGLATEGFALAGKGVKSKDFGILAKQKAKATKRGANIPES
jgi:hypothetical protein